MTRCRLHLFVPDDEDVPGTEEEIEEKREQLRDTFGEYFTLTDTPPVKSGGREWISDVFEDTDENLERIDEFEEACLEIYPEADALRTRQQRSVMDDTDVDYDDVIMLQVTHAILSRE